MKIKTLQFGEIEYDENLIVKFADGILGFEQMKDFLLIKMDDDIFYWLTSVDNPDIIFPLIGIRLIDPEYVEKPDNEAFGIVKLDKDPSNITVNLKAPVYINHDRKEGFQIILDNDKYPLTYKLFNEE
jgi:flagellar assembly factor FliW